MEKEEIKVGLRGRGALFVDAGGGGGGGRVGIGGRMGY